MPVASIGRNPSLGSTSSSARVLIPRQFGAMTDSFDYAPRGRRNRTRRKSYLKLLVLQVAFHIFFPRTNGLHHMKRAPLHYVSQRDESRPFSIVNRCAETIYPGIATQGGTPPRRSGFQLSPGGEVNLSVSADWQGRIWGRTNCSFNSDGSGPSTFGGVNGYGRSCSTGDCNGILDCRASVSSPAAHDGGLFARALMIVGNHAGHPGGIHDGLGDGADLLGHLPRRWV